MARHEGTPCSFSRLQSSAPVPPEIMISTTARSGRRSTSRALGLGRVWGDHDVVALRAKEELGELGRVRISVGEQDQQRAIPPRARLAANGSPDSIPSASRRWASAG